MKFLSVILKNVTLFASQITQPADHDSITFNSQLISAISRVPQKLLRSFYRTAISMSNVPPLTVMFLNIYLNLIFICLYILEFVMSSSSGSSLQYCHNLLLNHTLASQYQAVWHYVYYFIYALGK